MYSVNHTRLSDLDVLPRIRKVHTWLGMFGGPTPKPTVLWGTVSWLPNMHMPLDRSRFQASSPLVDATVSPSGKRKFRGDHLCKIHYA